MVVNSNNPVKCVRCQLDASQGKETSKGFVCNDCIKKEQRKKALLWGGLAALLIAGGVTYYFVNQKSEPLEGFNQGGYNDTIAVHTNQETPSYDLGNTTAIPVPVEAGSVATNIEAFTRVMEQNLQTAEANKVTQLAIPPIATMFSIGSDELRPEGIALLKEYLKYYLKTNREATILVEGYTCDIGTPTDNQKLSEKRTQAVASILAESVPQSKIETIGYGESKYSTLNLPTKEDHRRVVISIK